MHISIKKKSINKVLDMSFIFKMLKIGLKYFKLLSIFLFSEILSNGFSKNLQEKQTTFENFKKKKLLNSKLPLRFFF